MSYDFDALNQMTTKVLSSNLSQLFSYQYDLGSRLTDANNSISQIHYDYDDLNRVRSASSTINSQPYTINYQFDKVGNRKQLTYPSGKILDYVYTADDQLDLIKEGVTTVVDFDYDVLGRRSSRTTYPVSRSTYQYDSANQLTSLTNSLISGGNISQYQYPLYDTVGNRKQMIRKLLNNASKTTNYTYNKIYELTAVTGAQTNSYDYDAVHNREVANGASYMTNNVNQYTDIAGNIPIYDSDGNMVFDGNGKNYTYDELNRLISFSDGVTNANYEYDALNRRVGKNVDGVATSFFYDDSSVIADYLADGTLDAEYVLGDKIDEILKMEKGGSIYNYFYDGLGSVTELTDSNGAVVENYTYDVYGNPSLIASTIGNRYMFTGREWDEESQTYYYRARQYDAKIGRFLQRDPIGYYDSMNLYSYVQNSPINYTDPDGEEMVGMISIGLPMPAPLINVPILAEPQIEIFVPALPSLLTIGGLTQSSTFDCDSVSFSKASLKGTGEIQGGHRGKGQSTGRELNQFMKRGKLAGAKIKGEKKGTSDVSLVAKDLLDGKDLGLPDNNEEMLMKTITIQIQFSLVPKMKVDKVILLFCEFFLKVKDFVVEMKIDKGRNCRYININYKTTKITKLWEKIQKNILNKKIIGRQLQASTIIVCEGKKSWEDYILLYHFKKGTMR